MKGKKLSTRVFSGGLFRCCTMNIPQIKGKYQPGKPDEVIICQHCGERTAYNHELDAWMSVYYLDEYCSDCGARCEKCDH